MTIYEFYTANSMIQVELLNFSTFVKGGDEMIPDNEFMRDVMEEIYYSYEDDESYVVVEREEEEEEEE